MSIKWIRAVLLATDLAASVGCTGSGWSSGRGHDTPGLGHAPDALPVPVAAADDRVIRNALPVGKTLTAPSPAAQIAQDGPIALRVVLSRAACSKSAADCRLLKVEYAAAAMRELVDRPPLNIALVLDNSGSMAEARKLPYTLDAARWVVENLTERDVISMVAFNDRAIVLSGAGRAVNKPFLLHRLDEISAENLTNLSAGLLEGIAQASVHSADGQVNQVLLLTDGQPTRGETNPAALHQIAQQARLRGIGLSTFGVGSDFNERLLADLAGAGGGRYVYVKAPEQIPAAFKDELHGLLEVVGQNAVIQVNVTGGAIDKVYGQLLDEPTASYEHVIGDVRAMERGFVLAELGPVRTGSAVSLQADVRLVYDDPKAGTRLSSVANVRPSDRDQPEDPSIAILAAVLNAVEEVEIAAQGLDIERYRRATASFERLYNLAREFAIRTRDQELLNQTFVLKHFMAELAAAETEGLLHGHRDAKEKLKKESHYLRYLLNHHRPQS